MSYPSNVATVTVTATYVNSDGTVPTGTVTFSPNTILQDGTSSQIVVVDPQVVTLNANGSLSIVLMATDDTDLSPSGWAYNIVENIDGAYRNYFVQFPAAQTPVDLSTKAPLVPVPGLTGYVSLSAVGAASGVASLDSTGNVPLSQLGNAPAGGGPSNTVVSETNFGQSATAGVATTNSRGDHTHGSPSLGTTGTTAAAGNDSRITGAQQTSVLTTKGDIYAATAASTVARLGVGTNGQFLSANSATATGLQWVTGSGGGGNFNYRGAWAASTAYALNDVVSYVGGMFIATTGFTSGSVFSLTNWTNLDAPKGVYNVKWYGAQGDGVTDDVAAINAAVTAAYNGGVADGSMYAEVLFPPGNYLLSSATTAGTGNHGNAQIPLPVIATTGQKFTLAFRGGRAATSLPHWQQTSVQKSGVVLVSTIAQSVDGTFGPPSVIGGPTPTQGYGQATGTFTNLYFVVDGISISLPANPQTLGFDLSGVAEANIISASVNASVTPGSTITAPTHSWAVGLYMPQSRNNDNCLVQDYSCEGMYFGLILSEHSTVLHTQIIYCNTGIDILDGEDLVFIGYASVEVCNVFLQAEDLGGRRNKVKVLVLDIETANSGPFAFTSIINDPSNFLRGEINVHTLDPGGTSDQNPVVVGGANVRIINSTAFPGIATPPAVPASTVGLKNPFWRDAAVNVIGGTVTVIAVDGTTTGVTAGTVFVPSGHTITLTYSVAPTWVWTLL